MLPSLRESRHDRVASELHAMIARLVAAAMIALAVAPAAARPVGVAALLARHGDIGVAQRLIPRALAGDARAQAALGYLHATGRGVPQDYVLAAMWFSRAADQGHAGAQYMLGLMYDKGHGVPRDHIEAHKWLNLAVAGASRRDREFWVRIRDAIASKLTPAQVSQAQWRASAFQPQLER
jgi:uncharacterized protein